MTFWTPAMDARAVKLWNAGNSAAVIGIALGVTKNALIGRIHRMRARGVEIAVREPPKPFAAYARSAMKPKRQPQMLPPRQVSHKASEETKLAQGAADAHNPGTEGGDGCRWIMRYREEPRRRVAIYCGKTRIDHAWCAAHREIVFVTQTQGSGE